MNTGMDKWHRLLEHGMEFAAARLADKGEIAPMATLHCPDGRINLIALDVSTDRTKETSLKFARLLAIADDAEAVTLIGEMWMRTLTPYHGELDAEYEDRVAAVRPRDAEDRTEVVMVTVTYRDAAGTVRELSNSREILRGDDGTATGLAPPVHPDADVLFSEGPMTKILPAERPSREARRYASEFLKSRGVTGRPM